jgi:GT2 family glycosyltransferase
MSGVEARASVVVPVHGRAGLTRRCLEGILVDLPSDCEVVVVDDASADSTPQLLKGFGEAIRVVRLERNMGYGAACNAGAAVARGEHLVFLNNDTEPEPSWLEALLRYAGEHLEAAVVGAKLLYPTGVVQHAGIVFGQDGYPHNAYAGFPADHPVVNRPRRLQAVTGACMLVRRPTFERAGGFDRGFLNSMEDVDLCLRIGEAGGEVHYCPRATVVHFESATRGQSDRFESSVALYRRRWRQRVRRDDLAVYAEDGLIDVEYPNSHPLRISVSPLLASVARTDGHERELEPLLRTYGRHSADLLREVVRLTAEVNDRGGAIELTTLPSMAEGQPWSATEHADLLVALRSLEEEVCRLQGESDSGLGYVGLVVRMQQEVERSIPEGAGVLVISRGDAELLRLGARHARHFPAGPDSGYLGRHPANDEEAIQLLEAELDRGAEYLVIPRTELWWLQHYGGFGERLEEHHVGELHDSCSIYRLEPRLAQAGNPS